MSKVWLITGSSRGLGRALAGAVLAAGHRLVATARQTEDLKDLSEALSLGNGRSSVALTKQRTGYSVTLAKKGAVLPAELIPVPDVLRDRLKALGVELNSFTRAFYGWEGVTPSR